MKISVIVPVYNGEKTLGDCLQSLESCRDAEFEIIVVDDCSTDNTPQIVQKFPRVKLVSLKANLGAGGARAAGLEHATGEIIAFTDADCIVPEDWLESIRRLLTPAIGGIGGIYRAYPKQSFMGRYATYDVNNIWFRWLPDHPDHLATGNCAYWRNAIERIDQRKVIELFKGMAAAEDTLLGLMISRHYQLRYDPTLYVYHQSPEKKSVYFRQQMVRGFSRTIVSWMYFKEKVLHTRDISMGNVFLQLSTVGLTLLGMVTTPLNLIGFYLFLIGIISFTILQTKPFLFIYNEEKSLMAVIKSWPLIFLRNIAWMIGSSKGLWFLITYPRRNNVYVPENN